MVPPAEWIDYPMLIEDKSSKSSKSNQKFIDYDSIKNKMTGLLVHKTDQATDGIMQIVGY